MRITVVYHDFPVPANHGGRVDVWRRLQGFRRLGHAVQLLAWSDPELGVPGEAEISRVMAAVDDLVIHRVKRGCRAEVGVALNAWRVPAYSSRRALDGKALTDLLARVEAFSPDVVLVDGVYGAETGRALARRLKLPWAVRSHNIEHRYMAQQERLVGGMLRRTKRMLTTFSLERFERAALLESDLVFDISPDDLAFWREQGVRGGHWLPPLADLEFLDAQPLQDAAPDFDVVFLGNLFAPNNVDGLVWFVREVLPLLEARCAGVRVAIAGSNAGVAVRELCAAASRCVTLIENPPDAMATYLRGKVLINPVRSGSGVNLKALDMLVSGRPVVSTSAGVQGLPSEIKRWVKVADENAAFCAAIVEALATTGVDGAARRAEIGTTFGLDALARAAGLMEQAISARRTA